MITRGFATHAADSWNKVHDVEYQMIWGEEDCRESTTGWTTWLKNSCTRNFKITVLIHGNCVGDVR